MKMNAYKNVLPNEEIAGFYCELLENIKHDERSYGPSAFTSILALGKVPEDNNPCRLYEAVVAFARKEDQEQVAEEGISYFKSILNEYFPKVVSLSTNNTVSVKDITENDLPF